MTQPVTWSAFTFTIGFVCGYVVAAVYALKRDVMCKLSEEKKYIKQ